MILVKRLNYKLHLCRSQFPSLQRHLAAARNTSFGAGGAASAFKNHSKLGDGHADTALSLSYNAQTGLFRCARCGAKGISRIAHRTLRPAPLAHGLLPCRRLPPRTTAVQPGHKNPRPPKGRETKQKTRRKLRFAFAQGAANRYVVTQRVSCPATTRTGTNSSGQSTRSVPQT